MTDIIDEEQSIHSKETALSSSKLDEGEDESKIVSARGTEEGLVLRIDGRSEWEDVLTE